jgi:hypothetical protein
MPSTRMEPDVTFNLTPLSKAQRNVYETLRYLPARLRVNQRPGGLIPLAVIDCCDGRTVRSLINRHLIHVTEYGYEIVEEV